MSEITYDERSSTWLLEMPRSCYGIGLSGKRRLPSHLHWGRPLGHRALEGIAAAGPARSSMEQVSWGEEEPLECVGWGGRRYDEPTLKVDFADGTRGIEWQLTGESVKRDLDVTTLVLELGDLAYPLRVELCYRIFDDSDVLERWARLVHCGVEGPLIIRRAYSANFWMPERDAWRLTYLHGGWGTETQVTEALLCPGALVLESRRGTTSHQLQPWFALDAGDASEEHGEVWSGSIAWSGSWKLVAETTAAGQVHVTGGLNEHDSPLVLAPGDELVLPVFSGLYSSAGIGAMSRAWHAYERAHVLGHPERPERGLSFPARQASHRSVRLPGGESSRQPGEQPGEQPSQGSGKDAVVSLPALRPVLYNSWEATTFSVSEQGQGELAELAAAMGVELFVVDDGWFLGRNHSRAGLGDWTVDRAKFPRGLGPLIERVKRLEMGFGIWVEPEMVNPDSDLYRAHPDWVLHFAHRARSEKRNQLILNLARDDVAAFVYETLHNLLAAHEIDFVKWDMNRHFSEPGWPDMAGKNPERVWVDYVRNLYEILDRLRGTHPGVDIESCSGGGGRVDHGIMARTEQVWTSDNTDAWDRVAIQEGFSFAHAPMAMMAWVTDSPNPLTRRALPLRYRFHVAMAGSLGIGGNLAEWSPEELREAADLVSTYKKVRHVVQHGDLYRLASPRKGPLGAVQYVTADGAEVVVLAWSGVRTFRTWPSRVRLHGLDPQACYKDLDTGGEHLGEVLLEVGLELPRGLDFTSMLVHLERTSRTGAG